MGRAGMEREKGKMVNGPEGREGRDGMIQIMRINLNIILLSSKTFTKTRNRTR